MYNLKVLLKFRKFPETSNITFLYVKHNFKDDIFVSKTSPYVDHRTRYILSFEDETECKTPKNASN